MSATSPPVRDASAVESAVAARDLLAPSHPVVVMLSGGRDSVCLLDLAVRLAGADAVRAFHVNYGLRESADADEALCRRLCERAGVPLDVERPDLRDGGNLQARAREQRYAAADRLARGASAVVAAGHTADDQVETVLYRLAASPGRRALLGMRERRPRLVRPLLGIRRAETSAYCAERGLEYADDPSNEDTRYARNRVRHGLLPAWRGIHPAADEILLRTLAILRDEAAVLRAAVEGARALVGSPPRLEALASLEPALGRLVLQELADAALPRGAPAVGSRLEDVLELGRRGGSATLDLGGGLRAEIAYGVVHLRVEAARPLERPPDAARLQVPGSARFAGGVLTGERGVFPIGDGCLEPAAVGAQLIVRAWRPGDRMRPLGLGGSKRLQDLFTDAKVPRARRARLPVVVSEEGEIAWIPGIATGESFRVRDRSRASVRLSWSPPQYD